MEKINDIISYIPAGTEPLSSDVGVIKTQCGVWLCDVGSSEECLYEINATGGEKTVVLTHFHNDHIANLSGVENIKKLYVGENTFRYTNRGTTVNDEIFCEDGGVRFHIFALPSSHAKGSLGLEINGEYAFLGDGIYPCEKAGKRMLNAQLLLSQIRTLEKLEARYFLLSHQKNIVVEKEIVLRLLKEHYSLRRPDLPYIFL